MLVFLNVPLELYNFYLLLFVRDTTYLILAFHQICNKFSNANYPLPTAVWLTACCFHIHKYIYIYILFSKKTNYNSASYFVTFCVGLGSEIFSRVCITAALEWIVLTVVVLMNKKYLCQMYHLALHYISTSLFKFLIPNMEMQKKVFGNQE